MRKDSLIIFTTSIVLTLGIVGGAHYLYLQGQKATPDKEVGEPRPGIGNAQAVNRAVKPAVRRTATPIKCTQADGSVFWTNASRCEDADLNNRLSFAEPVKPAPRVKSKSSTFDLTQKAWTHTSQANSRVLKSIPRSMTNACSFPIGMAQRIETRSLSLKDPPKESLWKDSYCRWVCEARVENCGNLEDYLRYPDMCPRKWRSSKRACGT